MKNRGNGRWPPRRALNEATRQHLRPDGAPLQPTLGLFGRSGQHGDEAVARSSLSARELRRIVAAAIG